MLRRATFGVAALALATYAPPSFAQQGEEIIVTGSRIAYRDSVPVVHLDRRADFMVATVVVESDTRDAALRRDEVVKTITAMAERAARDPSIEVGIKRSIETEDDEIEYVTAFEVRLLDTDILRKGTRSDTTTADLILKTPIRNDDSFQSAFGRIKAFAKAAPVFGRAVVTVSDEPGLSLVDLEKYRLPLLRAIAKDNAAVAEAIGGGYKVSIGGLESPVRWRVTGPLDLAIYFPYTSQATPP